MGKSMVKINGTYVKSIENGRDGKVGGISTLLDFKQSLAIINVVSSEKKQKEPSNHRLIEMVHSHSFPS